MNINSELLVGFFKEVKASRDRARAETEHQGEIFKKAKAHGFDVKAMRIVLQRAAMGSAKVEEQDYFVDVYEHALGGKKVAIEALERGASVREAAVEAGISSSEAGRLSQNVKAGTSADKHASVREAAETKLAGNITVPPIEKVKKTKPEAKKAVPPAEPLPAHDAETGEVLPTVGQVAPPPLPEPPDNSDIFDPEPGPGKVLHPEEVNGLLDGAGVSPQERQEMAKLTQLKAPLVPKLTPEEFEIERQASLKRAMDRASGKAQAVEQAVDDLAIPEFLRRPKP